MLSFVLILFVLSCIILIFSVLLQSGHGGLGDIFGGGSGERAIFGGTGAKGFVGKVTIGAAVGFLATATILSVMYTRQVRVNAAPQVPVEQPAVPAGTPAGTPALPVGQK